MTDDNEFIDFEDLLIPSDKTLEKAQNPKAKLADANTQRQRIKNLIQSTGTNQPKANTSIDDDDAKPRWR
jgi:hypothetical protein